MSADKYFIRGYLSLWLFSAKILVGVWVYVLCIPFPCAYPISIFRQSFIGLFYIYLSACGSVWPFEINNADIVFGPDELWIWPIACHFSRISSVNIFFFASFLELIRRLYLGTVCIQSYQFSIFQNQPNRHLCGVYCSMRMRAIKFMAVACFFA